MADDHFYLVGENTTIHVYEGMSCVDIYEKEDKVPTFVTGFHRLDNELKEDGADRDGDVLDKDWAKDRNREIEKEVNELRERLVVLNREFKSHGVKIEKLLSERDNITYKYELAGEEFERLYLEKKESMDGREFTDDELLDPKLLARGDQQAEKSSEENLMDMLDRINSNQEEPKGLGRPNWQASEFNRITSEMLDLYSRKNTDYGDSFVESLDEDGLLVSKIRMKDKFKRFSQLIENDAQIDDETLEDTLIDLANYTVMTLMWVRDNE